MFLSPYCHSGSKYTHLPSIYQLSSPQRLHKTTENHYHHMSFLFTRRSSVPLSSAGIPFPPGPRATGSSFPSFSRPQHISLNSSVWNNPSNSSGNPTNFSIPQQQPFNGYGAGQNFYSSQPSAAPTYCGTRIGAPPNFRVVQVPAPWVPGTKPSNLMNSQSDTTNDHNQKTSPKESTFWDSPTQQRSCTTGSSRSVKDMYKDWLSGQAEDARSIVNECISKVKQSRYEVGGSTRRTDAVMGEAKRISAFISTHVAQLSDASLETDVATLSSLVDELSRDLEAERVSRRTLNDNLTKTTNAVNRAHRLAEERTKADSDPDLARSRNLWQTYKEFVPRSEKCECKHHYD